VKNVVQTWFRFTHTSIFTRMICVSGIIQFEEHSLFQEDYFIWPLVYISNNETLYLRYATTFDRVTFMRFPLMRLKNFSKIEDA